MSAARERVQRIVEAHIPADATEHEWDPRLLAELLVDFHPNLGQRSASVIVAHALSLIDSLERAAFEDSDAFLSQIGA